MPCIRLACWLWSGRRRSSESRCLCVGVATPELFSLTSATVANEGTGKYLRHPKRVRRRRRSVNRGCHVSWYSVKCAIASIVAKTSVYTRAIATKGGRLYNSISSASVSGACGTAPKYPTMIAPRAMRQVPVSMCHEKIASSMTRASSALYSRLTAPSGASITTGNVPI